MRRLANLHAMRQERREQQARRRHGHDDACAEAEQSGTLVVEAERRLEVLSATAPIVSDLSLRILRGDRLGIVGPNGAGKTTLINLLTGALAPDEGTRAARRQPADGHPRPAPREPRPDRDRRRDPDRRARRHGDRSAAQTKHVIGYMKDFLFAPEQARTPVGVLSGGERNRLMLARALAQPSNLLVLDEPTNDLDLETLDLLQEMITDYAGTVLLVSHDRDFLDRTVGSVLVSEGEGRWVEYAGGYTDMVAQRGAGRSGARRSTKDGDARAPTSARPLRRRAGQAQAQLQRAARPQDAARGGWRSSRRRSPSCRTSSPTPTLYARDPARFQKACDALDGPAGGSRGRGGPLARAGDAAGGAGGLKPGGSGRRMGICRHYAE